MRVEVSDTGFPPAGSGALAIHGRLVASQRNHPIMGSEPLPKGFIRLSLAPSERLRNTAIAPGAKAIGGLYQPLDRFGEDAI
jgi:hypothetical protein